MSKTSKVKWSYAAAMLDGEGHFSISSHKVKATNGNPYWLIDCKIGISNTSIPLMKWLKENFGGDYRDSKQGMRRVCYRWDLDGYEKMERFVLGVLPYLIIKREQALVTLEFLRMRGTKNPAKRLELAQKCKALNKGITPTTNTQDNLPCCQVHYCGPELPSNLKVLKIESDLHSDVQSAPAVTQAA